MPVVTFDGAAPGPLLRAVAASIAIHAAMLAGLPDLWTFSVPPGAAPLNARLEPGTQPVADAEPARAEGAPANRDPSPPQRRVAAPRPTPSAPEAAMIPTERAAGSDAARAPAATADGPVNLAVASPSAAAGKRDADPVPPAEMAAPAPNPGDGAPELGSIAQYRLALIGAAKRHKLYPLQAIERGWQGRVEIRLLIGADGALSAASVKRSSGHEMLDRQSLDMLRRAHALTPIPPALRHREFSVEVPVVYALKSEG